jgi:hypothetical protein
MNSKNENDDGLSKRLRSWKVDASLGPGTADQVWRRIALAESQAPSGFAAFLQSIEEVFSRPAVAGAYVTILLLAGVLGGSLFRSTESDSRQRMLASRYLASVDPYNRVRESGRH